MNPTEIYEALDAVASAPFDPVEFPFAFAEATDNAKATISKLRNGSTNKSDISGGVLLNRKFYYAPAPRGGVEAVLDRLRASKRTATAKPAILLTTDGEEVAAEQLAGGDPLHCRFDEIGDKFGFFLPAAGKERYQAVEENPIDVKATGRLAKLYDALIKANPAWGDEAHRHAMNQLMMRLIFCLFAEDVGIFPDGQFSRLLFTYEGNRGEEAREVIVAAFTAMNRPKDARSGLPAWTAELEYVNGGLFAGEIDAPRFDPVAFRYLRDAARLNWREINPDIFGSMIQSVADPKQRSELGMHYTSVPNIMKVLGPLFLDDLDAEIAKAWDKPRALQRVIDRMAGIRVFDPACGSGNFLVVAYRELRKRETRILARIAEIEERAQTLMFSAIPITHFYGIEITDFAAETAKLALFIAEYQANAKFGEIFGQMPASLPLKEAAHVRCRNSLEVAWESVCPPASEGELVFIVGNPPWVWSNDQTAPQKKEMKRVFEGRLQNYASLDYVCAWLLKARDYVSAHKAEAALVTTNSVTQGQTVPYLWPALLRDGVKVHFAHTTFKWANNAKANATVDGVVIGLSARQRACAYLYTYASMQECKTISPYLIPDVSVIVRQASTSLFELPVMDYGSKPIDGGHLIMSENEVEAMLVDNPEARPLIRRLYGSDEIIYDKIRYCLFIDDADLALSRTIPEVFQRIESVRQLRLMSPDSGAVKAAQRPHQFREHRKAQKQAIYLPAVSSENRNYLTPIIAGNDTNCTNRSFVLYDAPDWCLSLLSSSMHRAWVMAVCGKLQKRPNYSNTLGWNTFPVPNFTDAQKEQLSASARRILKTRYEHYPKTIAELYDPDKMPDDLRAAHKANDDLLETMYIGRPFRNDTERLEKLFKRYAARVKKEG